MKLDNLAVILNGPAGCGKDTLADLIVQRLSFTKRQFKDALYEHTAKYFEVGLDEFIRFARERELKDSTSLAGLGGRTPRQALIHVSENVYKPRCGDDYFGKVEADGVRELTRRLGCAPNVIYPDGGFGSETVPIQSVFGNLLIIRLHRPGYTFEGDSRDYVQLPNTENRKSVDIYLVDGDIEDGYNKVVEAIYYLEKQNYEL